MIASGLDAVAIESTGKAIPPALDIAELWRKT